jgi:uncharacterized membrane protein
VAPLPSRTSPSTTFFVGLGLLCCIYLAALKILNLPCPLSGCADIINTRYGSLFHVPLPVYAIPLWLILTVPASGPWQESAQLLVARLLGAGCLVLMGIQFIVLRGFCPFCTAHAVAAVATAVLLPKKGRAHTWLPAVMLALTFPVLGIVKATAVSRLESWQPVEAPAPGEAAAGPGGPSAPKPVVPASIDQVAFHWLGDFDPKASPILVVSFQCSHCLDLLEEVVSHPRLGTLKGPKIFVYSQPNAASDTIAVLAAMLSVPGTQEEQFASVFSQIEVLRDPMVTRDSKELKSRLGELFPHYTEKLAAARQQYNLQVVALKYIPGRGSPYLLLPDGTNRFGDIAPDMLFH